MEDPAGGTQSKNNKRTQQENIEETQQIDGEQEARENVNAEEHREHGGNPTDTHGEHANSLQEDPSRPEEWNQQPPYCKATTLSTVPVHHPEAVWLVRGPTLACL